MSTKESKAIVRRFLEDVWNKGNSDLVHEMLSAGFIRYGPAVEEVRGREGFQRLVATYRSGYPDLRGALEDQIAEGAL